MAVAGRRFAAVALAALAAGACGGGAARPAPAAPPVEEDRASVAPPEEEEVDDGVEVEGLRGHLDPYQIEQGVKPHQRALTRCYQSRLRATRFVGGAIELGFSISPAGEVSQVTIAKSDLGSWAVEKCLLETARTMRFASPKGGAAEFTLPLDFQGARGKVLWWEEERADRELEKKLPELADCDEAGVPSDVWVTFYVGNRGAVKSVGFASPGPIDDDWAACASEVIDGWSVSDPRGQIAKAGFRYRAP